ncbi:MAG: dienelactone hydrolase [bacterium]|nr:dienelactone hydrolase [bacterium]
MKRTGVILTALVVLAVAHVAGCGYITRTLVTRAIPDFPQLPPPVSDLSQGQKGTIYFQTTTPFDLDVLLAKDRATPTTGLGTLFLPEGGASELVPGMIVLHGSGGISPGREMEYGQLLADHGIAAFVLDYYLPRGVTDETDYMMRVLSVTEFDAISDAYAALQLLGTHPRVDAERIGVVGYSYGGMAARFAMDERIRRALAPDHPGFAAYVDYYGPCFQRLGTRETNGAPLLTLRGTEDASNDLEACTKRESELRAIGNAVEAHVYQGAGHAWEVTNPRQMIPDAPYVEGCEVVYDENGRSSVNGEPIVDVPIETSRVDRILVRVASGDQMKACLKSGYVIGRDDETKALTDKALLSFLDSAFARN